MNPALDLMTCDAPPTSMTHAHIAAAVASEVGPAGTGPLRVVDAGCGNGLLIRYLTTQLRTTLTRREVELSGFDVADSGHVVDGFPVTTRRMLDEAHPDVDWSSRIWVSALDEPWPYDDASVDVVVSNQVIEHVFEIDRFFAELHRVLRPGGVSVHVFPFERVLWECHLRMPLVHRLRSHDALVSACRAWNRLGFGRFSSYRDHMREDEWAEMSAQLMQLACRYRSWRELSGAATAAGLLASHRYTDGYYLQKLRSRRGRPLSSSYRRPSSTVREAFAFATLPYVASGTMVLSRPRDDTPWQLDA